MVMSVKTRKTTVKQCRDEEGKKSGLWGGEVGCYQSYRDLGYGRGEVGVVVVDGKEEVCV